MLPTAFNEITTQKSVINSSSKYRRFDLLGHAFSVPISVLIRRMWCVPFIHGLLNNKFCRWTEFNGIGCCFWRKMCVTCTHVSAAFMEFFVCFIEMVLRWLSVSVAFETETVERVHNRAASKIWRKWLAVLNCFPNLPSGIKAEMIDRSAVVLIAGRYFTNISQLQRFNANAGDLHWIFRTTNRMRLIVFFVNYAERNEAFRLMMQSLNLP